jgi:excisionase family DNA binding protein
MTGEWLKVKDVAALLQVSERTVARLISEDAGPERLLSAKIGGSVRIRRTTLENWLRARERAA